MRDLRSEQEVLCLRVTRSESWGDLSPTVLEVASQVRSIQTALSQAHKVSKRDWVFLHRAFWQQKGKEADFPFGEWPEAWLKHLGMGGYSDSTLVWGSLALLMGGQDPHAKPGEHMEKISPNMRTGRHDDTWKRLVWDKPKKHTTQNHVLNYRQTMLLSALVRG